MRNKAASESIEAYRTGTSDYRRGYDWGWDDAYRELSGRDERYTPPWFRRFFWYPKESFGGDKIPYLTNVGHDETCNAVLGVRLWGGMLNIRYGWKLRMPKDGRCNECLAEEQEWRGPHAS